MHKVLCKCLMAEVVLLRSTYLRSKLVRSCIRRLIHAMMCATFPSRFLDWQTICNWHSQRLGDNSIQRQFTLHSEHLPVGRFIVVTFMLRQRYTILRCRSTQALSIICLIFTVFCTAIRMSTRNRNKKIKFNQRLIALLRCT